MFSLFNYVVFVTLLVFLTLSQAGVASGQSEPAPCIFAGAYRIDAAASDKLYSAVEGATIRAPYRDQQRFFMDLSTRLTPPDMIAIECRGRKVSIASSRSPKITFSADGVTRREARKGGRYVSSRVVLASDKLTFMSSGNSEDSVNVTFRALDGGQRLKVTRSITTEQLNEPIVIDTVYNKFAVAANWEDFGNGQRDRETANAGERGRLEGASDSRRGSDEANVLRGSLDDWIAATNGRDIGGQMAYYMPELKAYYLSRNTPRQAVLDEKQRVFKTARTIDIAAAEPEIVFQDSGRTAVMRFHKTYKITDRGRTKSGEVIQELRWQKTPSGWRIFSERDIRVLR